MNTYNFLILLLLFYLNPLKAQELDAQVIINSDLVNQTN